MGNHDLMELHFFGDKGFLKLMFQVRMYTDLFRIALKIYYFFLILLIGPICSDRFPIALYPLNFQSFIILLLYQNICFLFIYILI